VYKKCENLPILSHDLEFTQTKMQCLVSKYSFADELGAELTNSDVLMQ